jgi:Zn ribbon nucleic-acid-binding protein
MQSIDFPGAVFKIGAGQDQYNTLHAMPVGTGEEDEVVMVFELTDEEVEQIRKTKKLFYHRLRFSRLTPERIEEMTKTMYNPFQPFRISTEDPGIFTYNVAKCPHCEAENTSDRVTCVVCGYLMKIPETPEQVKEYTDKAGKELDQRLDDATSKFNSALDEAIERREKV